MLYFDELRITPDGKHLIIQASVVNAKYYEDITLDAIVIDTQKTFTVVGPSSKPFAYITECQGKKTWRQVIDIDSVADNLFFVYVIAAGEAQAGAPCGVPDYIMGVTYDKKRIYDLIMPYLNQMEGCDVGSGLLDKMLQFEAFNISLHTCNYLQAIEFWNKFYSTDAMRGGKAIRSKCGCHGRS